MRIPSNIGELKTPMPRSARAKPQTKSWLRLPAATGGEKSDGDSFVSASRDDTGVKRFDLIEGRIPRERPGRFHASGRQLFPCARLIQNGVQRARQLIAIMGDNNCSAVQKERRNAAPVGEDYGNTCGHRFPGRVAEIFILRWQHKYVGIAIGSPL